MIDEFVFFFAGSVSLSMLISLLLSHGIPSECELELVLALLEQASTRGVHRLTDFSAIRYPNRIRTESEPVFSVRFGFGLRMPGYGSDTVITNSVSVSFSVSKYKE